MTVCKLPSPGSAIDVRTRPGKRCAPWPTIAVWICATLASGCIHHIPTSAPKATTQFERSLELRGRFLTLHLATGSLVSSRPMIMYVTGDGGWHRKDLAVYKELVTLGYPVVGISAPEYLQPLRKAKQTTTPAAVARDYAAILSSARKLLDVSPSANVILVGVSRGADLVIVAAGQDLLRPQLSGVVAVGLTREEEFVRWFRRVGRGPRNRARVATMMQLYEYLPRLGATPVDVIQSTHDTYLPAADARRLYGADTERRRLQEIESRNHSFSDARPALYAAIRNAIDWVAGPNPVEGTTR